MIHNIRNSKFEIKKYIICLLHYALCLLLFSSCVKDTPPKPTTTATSINSNNKVYIVNEGQFMNVPGNANVSIYASGNFMGREFDAFSDARIKNIIGVSNSGQQ